METASCTALQRKIALPIAPSPQSFAESPGFRFTIGAELTVPMNKKIESAHPLSEQSVEVSLTSKCNRRVKLKSKLTKKKVESSTALSPHVPTIGWTLALHHNSKSNKLRSQAVSEACRHVLDLSQGQIKVHTLEGCREVSPGGQLQFIAGCAAQYVYFLGSALSSSFTQRD